MSRLSGAVRLRLILNGGIKNRSNSTNLISFLEDIALSKNQNGVHGKVLRLLESYLQNSMCDECSTWGL